MKANYLILLSVLFLQGCVIIDEFFPPERVQVVDPVRRAPLLNGNIQTDVRVNAINNKHAFVPAPPVVPAPPIPPTSFLSAPNGEPLKAPSAAVSARAATVPPVPALPTGPVFGNPYQLANQQANPSVAVTSAPIAAPLAPRAPILAPQIAAQQGDLEYPNLSEVRRPANSVRSAQSAELDSRVQNLKRELEASKARRPVQVAAPAIAQSTGLTRIPNQPIIRRSVEAPAASAPSFSTASAPIAAPRIPAAPIAVPRQVVQRSPIATPTPAPTPRAFTSSSNGTITLPSQLRRIGAIEDAPPVRRSDYNNGFVYNAKGTYRHSNRRRGY